MGQYCVINVSQIKLRTIQTEWRGKRERVWRGRREGGGREFFPSYACWAWREINVSQRASKCGMWKKVRDKAGVISRGKIFNPPTAELWLI
jgi:hypothetical protein